MFVILLFTIEWCAASMSHVLRLGIKRSPTVPVLPREGVLLLESLPLPPAFRAGLDLDGDLLVFREADRPPELPIDPGCEPGATNRRDGDNNRDAERDRPDKL